MGQSGAEGRQQGWGSGFRVISFRRWLTQWDGGGDRLADRGGAYPATQPSMPLS